jgi:imidazolonepropionase-like amidohydrolase
VTAARSLPGASDSGRWRPALRRLLRDPATVIGLVGVTIFVLVAVAGPVIAGTSYLEIDIPHRSKPPNATHLFGTDQFGRDLLARVTTGSRVSLLVGVVSTLIGGGRSRPGEFRFRPAGRAGGTRRPSRHPGGAMNLIIRPGRVIDATGSAPQTGVEVTVADDRITDIRPVTKTAARGGVTVIDAPDATLMPGLIDLHMHVFQWGQRHDIPWQNESILEAGIRGIRNASTLLDMGVTTARDVASRDNLSIQLRDLINAGMVRGPRFFASGTQLEAAGRAAYFFQAIYINGVDEARAAARRQLRAGADWIKIMATAGIGGGTGKLVGEPGWQELSEDEMRAAAAEAHGPGRKITAHAIGTAGIKAALRAGVDCIEHGDFLDDEAIELMLARDVPLVPTLQIAENLGVHGAERGFQQNVVERAVRTLDTGLRNTLRAHRAGIRVAVGSDVDFDETAAQEIRMLIRAGLSPMEALMAGTKVAASVLDLGAELGTVEKGKIADLILLDGDPLADPMALDRVTHVVHKGALVKSPTTAPAPLVI